MCSSMRRMEGILRMGLIYTDCCTVRRTVHASGLFPLLAALAWLRGDAVERCAERSYIGSIASRASASALLKRQ